MFIMALSILYTYKQYDMTLNNDDYNMYINYYARF